jgi:dCMP deaminase
MTAGEVARRPDGWDAVFLGIAAAAAGRSKDPASRFGAVLAAPDRRVLSVGYNGPPPQVDDAAVPWGERPAKYAYILHAEENAILFGLDAHGFAGVAGATLYVTGHPCPGCVLRAARAGVAEVRWRDDRRAACVDAAAVAAVGRLLAALKPGRAFRLTEVR